MTSYKYKKKPIIVEALQWNGNNINEIKKITNDSSPTGRSFKVVGDSLIIKTLEGDMRADINDFIIKGVQGEYYPCKPDIFQRTYESVD